MSWLQRIVVFGFGATATALSLCAIAAFLGFAHPLLDLLNHAQPVLFPGALLALVTTTLLKPSIWRAALVTLTATGFLASGVIVVPEFMTALTPRAPLPTDGRPVYRLMTHNLLGSNDRFGEIAGQIAALAPDILTFQEYFAPQHRALQPLLSGDYPYFARCNGGRRGYIAIYARLPFEIEPQAGCIPGSTARVGRLIAHFVGSDGRPFAVATTHLAWPVPIARQQGEFAELKAAMLASSGPLLLTGDFNSTAWSYTLRHFVTGAGMVRHTRNLATWPRRLDEYGLAATPAALPIDHVVSRGPAAVHGVAVGDPVGSDHAPVIVDFSVQ
jgi:endonuclease/exonuclease/phosphatase (EEP) superfamily protein YafD